MFKKYKLMKKFLLIFCGIYLNLCLMSQTPQTIGHLHIFKEELTGPQYAQRHVDMVAETDISCYLNKLKRLLILMLTSRYWPMGLIGQRGLFGGKRNKPYCLVMFHAILCISGETMVKGHYLM